MAVVSFLTSVQATAGEGGLAIVNYPLPQDSEDFAKRSAAPALGFNESAFRILSGQFSPKGAFQLQISLDRSLAYQVQASSNLVNWLSLGSPVTSETASQFQDLQASTCRRRFYRVMAVPSRVQLAKANGNAFELFSMTGGPFQPDVATTVHFQDALGQRIAVRSLAVTTNRVEVVLPCWLSWNQSTFSSAAVSVTVQQGANLFGSSQSLQMAPLPSIGLSPGMLTLDYLRQLTNMLATASNRWQTIETASQGALDTLSLRRSLMELHSSVVAAQTEIERIINQPTLRIFLGRIGDRNVLLDGESVLLLDRMIAASILNYPLNRTASQLSDRPLARAAADPIGCADLLACLRDEFNRGAGSSAQSTLAMLEKWNSMGGVGVGVMAATAVVFGLASAPVAATAAGTAGAILFFSTYVAPAVMGASTLSFAAPFIEAQTGNPVSLDDYRPALSHLHKGSQAYLIDELQGRLLEGTLKSVSASEDLVARASIGMGASKSILGQLDLNQPQSVAAQSFTHSSTIFAHLVPENGGAATYSGQYSTTMLADGPEAAWRRSLSFTLKIYVSGQGTAASPYTGAFQADGKEATSLLYCNSSAGCDPGYTATYHLDQGLVSGSGGIINAQGLGSVTAVTTEGTFSGTILWKFNGGTISGNNLTGSLLLDDEPVGTVTLTKP